MQHTFDDAPRNEERLPDEVWLAATFLENQGISWIEVIGPEYPVDMTSSREAYERKWEERPNWLLDEMMEYLLQWDGSDRSQILRTTEFVRAIVDASLGNYEQYEAELLSDLSDLGIHWRTSRHTFVLNEVSASLPRGLFIELVIRANSYEDAIERGSAFLGEASHRLATDHGLRELLPPDHFDEVSEYEWDFGDQPQVARILSTNLGDAF